MEDKSKVSEHHGEPHRVPKEELKDLPATTAKGGTDVAIIDYGKDTGAGMEKVTRDEVKVPILRILQSNSPQIKPAHAGGIPGAQAAMIFNTATREMWDVSTPEKHLLFIPVHRDSNVVEYVPRDAGGGFVGIHDAGYELLDLCRAIHGRFAKQPVLPPAAWEEKFVELARAHKLPKGVAANAIPVGGRTLKWEDAKALYRELNPPGGTELVPTFYLYHLLLTPDGMLQRDVTTFSSTQIDVYQSFMTRYTGFRYPNSRGESVQPPLWAHRCRLGTTFMRRKKGEFYGWVLRLDKEPPIESRMRLDDPAYKASREFYDLLKSGGAQIDREADLAAGGGAADEEEEMPF